MARGTSLHCNTLTEPPPPLQNGVREFANLGSLSEVSGGRLEGREGREGVERVSEGCLKSV
jgi:hypothetical protein